MVSISKNTELKAQIKVYKYSAFFFFFFAVLSIIAAIGCPGGCMLSKATKLLCSVKQQKDTLYYNSISMFTHTYCFCYESANAD